MLVGQQAESREGSSSSLAGRQAKRFHVNQRIPVGVLGGGLRFTGEMIDISSNGIMIECPMDIPVGTVVRLGISFGHRTARIVATARRCIPGVGTAFEFLHMHYADREMIHHLLLQLATSALTPKTV